MSNFIAISACIYFATIIYLLYVIWVYHRNKIYDKKIIASSNRIIKNLKALLEIEKKNNKIIVTVKGSIDENTIIL